MKTNAKRESLTFGGMLIPVKKARGKDGLKGLVWLAVKMQQEGVAPSPRIDRPKERETPGEDLSPRSETACENERAD